MDFVILIEEWYCIAVTFAIVFEKINSLVDC